MATSAIQKLATWRTRGTRASEQIVQEGVNILQNGGLTRMGDEGSQFFRATLFFHY